MDKSIGKMRWWQLSAIWLTYEVNYLDRIAVLVFLPFIRKDLGLTHAQAGVAASVFFFFYALTMIFMGPLADRIKPKKLMNFAIGLFSISTFLIGFVQNVWQFYILRAFLGWGEATQFPPIHKCIAEWFPASEKGRATAILSLAWGLAPAILPPFLTFMFATFNGWRPVFAVLFGFGIAALLLIAFAVYDSPDSAKKKGKISEAEYDHIKGGITAFNTQDEHKVALSDSSKMVLGDRSFWFWTATFFCSLALLWGTASWIPSYLYEQHKFSLTKMGLLAAVPYLFAGLGQLTAGWLADKVFHGRTKYLVIASMLITVPILVYLSNVESGNITPLMISLALLGFFVYAPHPVLYGYMQKRYPKEAIGYAIGVSNGLSQFGSFVAPLVMGYLVITTSSGIFYTNAFLFLGGIAFAGAVFSFLISEKKFEYSRFMKEQDREAV